MLKRYIQLKSFINRLLWLRKPMGGAFSAARYLFAAYGKPFKVGQLVYKGIEFNFRNCDATAVKEVLIDEEYTFLSDFLELTDKPTVIDIGAHIGSFSVWVYHKNKKARFLMVEADPATFEILTSNIARTLPAETYEMINSAAWRDNGVLNFSTESDSMGHKIAQNGNIQVRGITFQQIIAAACKNKGFVDLMKVDIEGAEEAFFETAGTDLHKVRNLAIELHPKLCDTEAVRKKLEQRYKNIQEIPGRIDSKPVLYCTDNI